MHSWHWYVRRIALFTAGIGSMLGAVVIQFQWFDAATLAAAPVALLAGLLGLLLLPVVVLGGLRAERRMRRATQQH
ncbi:MAG: hypothetical protein EA380_09635 [Phycisphaeraceae bacterium]|nr:MAG: hypothetical protein EA380_09635 [Phycisphaeraceae bacterium]